MEKLSKIIEAYIAMDQRRKDENFEMMLDDARLYPAVKPVSYLRLVDNKIKQ